MKKLKVKNIAETYGVSPKTILEELAGQGIELKDAADMILFLFHHPRGTGLYNIGSGRAETWNALAAAAFEALDKPVNIEYVEMPEHLRDRYQYYTKAEMGKLKALGYTREATSLHDSILDDIRNYLVPERYLGDEPAGK